LFFPVLPASIGFDRLRSASICFDRFHMDDGLSVGDDHLGGT
jgi:hypothetical protein